jgi:hypothetical protein
MSVNYPSRKHKPTQGVQRRDLNAAERVQLALKLRASGLTYDQIAAQAGYDSRGSAYKAVQRELQRNLSEGVEQMRREELHMLNILHAEMWLLAMDRGNQWRHTAVDRILAISERKAKLMGLDVPVNSGPTANMVVIREVPAGLLGELQS